MIEGIIIDAGHGGIDSGAIGNNLLEKDLNLQAAQYLYNRLKELGIPTKLVRDNDEYLPKEERVRRIKKLYNNSPYTILISNHMNAGNGEGAEIVYSLKNDSTLADLILNNIKESGQKVRRTYQRRLPENPNLDYYYILRETGNTTPLLIEYGFIDNINDSKRLKNNLNDYVEGVVKGLTEYLNYPYIPPNKVLEYYTVQKNDTLYSISRKFNIPIDKLIEINNLTSDILSIGQILYLEEKSNPDYDTYTVVKGDSLWGISKKYDIRVNDLIELNNLSDLNIKVGQTLLVPKQIDNTYIVEKGDTLWSISKKNNISVNDLKELNNLTSNTISIGQILKIK
ncbi:MAG: LysM peptidoglycan-binding domain-containing protein [Bacilli bacterium]|nr:LysM peptidoglycan-binding domain-containing protein [Bacilli bacterium]